VIVTTPRFATGRTDAFGPVVAVVVGVVVDEWDEEPHAVAPSEDATSKVANVSEMPTLGRRPRLSISWVALKLTRRYGRAAFSASSDAGELGQALRRALRRTRQIILCG
jgi:hypothetical protein